MCKVIHLHGYIKKWSKLELQVVLVVVYVYIASYIYIANVRTLMFTLTCNYL